MGFGVLGIGVLGFWGVCLGVLGSWVRGLAIGNPWKFHGNFNEIQISRKFESHDFFASAGRFFNENPNPQNPPKPNPKQTKNKHQKQTPKIQTPKIQTPKIQTPKIQTPKFKHQNSWCKLKFSTPSPKIPLRNGSLRSLGVLPLLVGARSRCGVGGAPTILLVGH